MKYLFTLFVIASTLSATVPTPGERSNFTHFTKNDEIAFFLNTIAASPNVRIDIIGETVDQDAVRMATLCNGGEFDTAKPTVFIFASQHGDEQSGKEAMLQIIRDTANGNLAHVLKEINLLIVPAVNIYGIHENSRRNAQDLDLNRDHVKLQAPESRALHQVFRRYLPQVTLDVHEKGPDYYLEQIGVVSNLNISGALQNYSRKSILPDISEKLARENITFHEYLIKQSLHYDYSTGAAPTQDYMNSIHYLYRFSTPDVNDGRNSFGIYNTLSFILEGVSNTDLNSLKDRTDRQYLTVRYFIEHIAEHAQTIKQLVDNEREKLAVSDDLVHLRMHYTADAKEPTLTIKTLASPFEDSALGIANKDIHKNTLVTQYDLDMHLDDLLIKQQVITDWRPIVHSDLTVTQPAAYLIPPERTDIIKCLQDHGFSISMTTRDQKLVVTMYKILDITSSTADHKAPSYIKVERETTEQMIRSGSFIIPVQGMDRNILPILLEPQSQYGLIRYFKFDLIPEAGNYFEIYRLDSLENIKMVDFN